MNDRMNTKGNLSMNTMWAIAIAGLGLATACDKGDSGPRGKLDIDVAPLTLPGVKNACYTVIVTNEAQEVVWRQAHVCADRFGDGVGAISYIGTCDADTADSVGPNDNTVTLVLESLYDADGTNAGDLISEATYVNPCGLPAAHALNTGGSDVNYDGFGPCTVTKPCRENEDVQVTFNLTVMRDATQGFFDIAVNFEDIFCSAKVDCLDDLLHYPDGWTTATGTDVGGQRGPTSVFGFACTSGSQPDGTTPEATWLYLSDLTVTCAPGDIGPFVLHVADLQDGNQGPASDSIFQWAQYTGEESVAANIDKCFWNYAIGLDLTRLAGHQCTLTATGTASATPFAGPPLRPPADHVWPLVSYSVDLTRADGSICDNNGLNLQGSGVTTTYYVPDGESVPPTFQAVRHCGADHPVACTDAPGVTFAATTVSHGGAPVPGVEVVAGGHTASFPLPPLTTAGEWTVAGCCLDTCCVEP